MERHGLGSLVTCRHLLSVSWRLSTISGLDKTLHPETKVGIAQAAAMNRAVGNNVAAKMSATSKSFVEDTAGKLNVAPRTVRREIQTAKNLTQEAKEIMKSADASISKKAAMKLSRLEPGQQKEAAALLAAKEIRTVDEYKARTEGRGQAGLTYEQEAALCYRLDKAKRRLSLSQSTNNTALRFARVILEKYNGQRGGKKLPYWFKG